MNYTSRTARMTAEGPAPRKFQSREVAWEELKPILASIGNNSPDTTIFDDADFTRGFWQQLGEALVGNTHVSTLCLQMTNHKDYDGRGTLKMPETHEEQVAALKHRVALLLAFLRTGSALRRVDIDDACSCDVLDDVATNLVLSAVHENRNVQELNLILNNIPVSFFDTMLPATESLTKLFFGIKSEITEEERRSICEGISSNTSMTSLKIYCDVELSVAILTCLADKGAKPPLKELSVTSPRGYTSDEFWRALSYFLHVKNQAGDFHLELNEFAFCEEKIKDLVYVLTGSYPVANDERWNLPCSTPVGSKLTLRHCNFYPPGDDAWRSFMLARVAPSLEATSGPVRELALSGISYFDWASADLFCMQPPDEDNNVKPQAPGERPIAAVPMQATVGSQIQSLSVSRYHPSFDGLFRGLADNAERIRVQTLRVPNLEGEHEQEHVAALALCIAKVSSLRHLDFDDDFFLDSDGKFPVEIVASMKRNEHVQSVSSNVQSEIVLAYCERNQFLEPLLRESSRGSKKELESSAVLAPAGCPQGLDPVEGTYCEMDGSEHQADKSGGSHKKSRRRRYALPSL